ncbi:MAG: LytTR family transcriptional regulator [Caulobacter sp.]|nr:LytTR family transcriptional regulator [Caulobacter sp.]
MARDLFTPLLDETSSALIWLGALPVIVRAFKTFVPARFPWLAIPPLHLAAAAAVSLAHYGLTRLLRALVYFGLGQDFHVPFNWNDYVGDLYGDVLNYLLFGLIYWGAETLLTKRAEPAETVPAPMLEVRNGAQTVYLPIADILWVEAAGNYVELHATGGRDILMRATLASLAQRLEGAGFLRVHRSRLVNAAFVSEVENLPAGDANVVLRDGARLTASRRYRSMLAQTLGDRARAGVG